MHHGADPVKLLDHEPPRRRRLERHLELLAAQLQEGSDTRCLLGNACANGVEPTIGPGRAKGPNAPTKSHCVQFLSSDVQQGIVGPASLVWSPL
jgi:hypothetical protein